MISLDFGSASQLSIRAGILKDIPRVAQSLGARRALLVTGDSTTLSVLVGSIAKSLDVHAGIASVVFSGIQSSVSESVVYEATGIGRRSDIDLVIGVGGDSAIAAAKLIACLLADNVGNITVDQIATLSCRRFPLILVPTTSGSGSEVTSVSNVVTASQDIKRIASRSLFPDVVLLDPEITLDLPWHVTAAVGIDAIGHAIEAYRNGNLLTEMLAARALKLLVGAFPKVLDQPDNLSVRSEMMAGSTLAGMASGSASISLLHALSLPLASRWFLASSLASALMLVPLLQFSVPSASSNYEQLAGILGLKNRTTSGFIDAIRNILIESNLPIRLKDVGVTKESFDSMTLAACKLSTDCSFDLTAADARRIYEAAYNGW